MNTASISFPLFGEGFVLNPPTYFAIFGFNIYYYGVLVTAGFVLAALYLIKRSSVIGLTKDNALDLVLIAVPAGLVGARIYFVIFNLESYFGPGANWQGIFSVREGGLAVYGGIILSGLAYIAYSRIKKIPIGKLLDAAGFGLFIGQSVGRWGNFFNREAFGVETQVPWRMGLTFDRNVYFSLTGETFAAGSTHYFHPAFLYEMLWNCVGLLLMHIFSKKRKTKYPGQYFLFYVAWYGLGRFIIEGLRVDSLFIHGTNIRASQLVALASCLIAIALLVIKNLRFRVQSLDPEP
ncbi:MAG: prolipoprotein diacylglyceryl transferase [Oscillospiraceae bacterium]|nr:prolipoprotein diacylglyceryl transferase [Oscillospiraceae bacterium]